MDVLINLLIVFISTLISVSVLGVIAGFSPTLYITQVAITSKSKKQRSYTAALMAGIVTAIFILIILFQTVHLDTLISFIDTTLRALTISVTFNILVGGGFVYGGIWYLRHQKVTQKPSKLKKTSGIVSVFGLGFMRTFISISGLTATYIAGNIIASVSIGFIERLIYTAIFLTATIVPFVAITIYMKKNPERIMSLIDRLTRRLQDMNYRLAVGVAAIILGCSIIFFNVMMALFY